MRIDIVVVYIQRYEQGHEVDFVPPITGIHLAAITPAPHQVRVIHQQVEKIPLDTDADLVALSFFSGFAPEAYRLAAEFRRRGKIVVAGGPHATFSADEVLRYCDAVVIGEAESVWARLLEDAEAGRLQSRYEGEPSSMRGIPTPRYHLLPKRFFVPRVVQATRGCPFTCSFCTVPTLNPGFRMRPVDEVLENIRYEDFPYWWQRKIVWFWDDNLTIRRDYARELLTRMVPLKRWWLSQASMDIAKDEPLLDLMQASGCIGIFFGIESFGEESLADARKRQNRVAEYRERIEALHRRGICVMAGFIAGFDGDTPDAIRAMARQLYDIGVDVPFLSILTPYRGTALHAKLEGEGRVLPDRGWEHYNGYNVSFLPARMTPEELLAAHRALWKEAFSVRYSARRIFRALFRLRLGAFLMCAMMNLFYFLKALRGNSPAWFGESHRYDDFRHLPGTQAASGPVDRMAVGNAMMGSGSQTQSRTEKSAAR
ncbi:MAG TPA: radical SAM protein [Candidatus Polarisedimenticolia bacterium]|nr:radical SAM protein [Candidatus Polarisedimenticolia bacterium]